MCKLVSLTSSFTSSNKQHMYCSGNKRCCNAQACNRQGYFCVPLYDTLGENAVEYIISHSGASALFASADKLPTLAKALPKLERGQVSTIVYWGTGAGNDARFEQARKPTCEGVACILPAQCPLEKATPVAAHVHLCSGQLRGQQALAQP